MLRNIQSQADRLVTLVDDLIIVSKVEGGTLRLHKHIFDLDTFITKLVRDFQQDVSTHKIIIAGKTGRAVSADKDGIAQVLINLLSNAVKYSPRGKKIFVRIACRKNKCVVSVEDFGPGIAKKDHRDIFTRFFRTHTVGVRTVSGSGLGLYISKGIIQKHRERLWVQSNAGKGSTFSFTLSFAPRRIMNG